MNVDASIIYFNFIRSKIMARDAYNYWINMLSSFCLWAWLYILGKRGAALYIGQPPLLILQTGHHSHKPFDYISLLVFVYASWSIWSQENIILDPTSVLHIYHWAARRKQTASRSHPCHTWHLKRPWITQRAPFPTMQTALLAMGFFHPEPSWSGQVYANCHFPLRCPDRQNSHS